MAHVYPEAFPEGSASNAERLVFETLAATLGSEYTVLAQLAWMTSGGSGRPYEGEVDLTIVHESWGLLVVEVKGGIVSYDPAAGWASNGFSIKDPVLQARNGAHELARRLGSAPATRGYSYPFGYGVWFPHGDKLRLPPRPDAPDEIVLDAQDVTDPERAIEGLYSYWLGDSLPPEPGASGVEALVKLLAPSWTLRPLLGRAIKREATELRRLTDQQINVLRMLGRRPRALISGCAGSGKTVLAMEKAR